MAEEEKGEEKDWQKKAREFEQVFYGPAPRSHADEVRARIAAEHEAASAREANRPGGIGAGRVAMPGLLGGLGRE
ncbi:hypothetical protein JL722_6628 [Aureococcus anophagefferens]|nr:hypothetical protein JL722_6628 [Aureococcus anophagefferens]